MILIGQCGGACVEFRSSLRSIGSACVSTGPAHHLRLEHPLFHSPLEVDPKLEQMPTPENYPYLTLDKKLGPTMTVWKVQTKDYPEIDPGLVSGTTVLTIHLMPRSSPKGIAGQGT